MQAFIIGAPKCGTSSIFSWLAAHPGIEGSDPKETFFFMDFEHPLCGRHGSSLAQDGVDSFGKFYNSCSDNEGTIRLEASTHTYYQRAALRYMSCMRPKPMIMMFLREPGARLISSFRYTRDNLAKCDSTLTFDRYVELLLSGRLSELDKYYSDSASLWIAKRELELCEYKRWVDLWATHFARSDFKITPSERMFQQPASTIAEVCSWLNLDAHYYSNFEFLGHNKTYRVRNQSVHRSMRTLGRALPQFPLRDRLKSQYLKWQRYKAPGEHDYCEGLRRIRRYFAPHNRDLDARYNLGLEKWWGKEVLNADL